MEIFFENSDEVSPRAAGPLTILTFLSQNHDWGPRRKTPCERPPWAVEGYLKDPSLPHPWPERGTGFCLVSRSFPQEAGLRLVTKTSALFSDVGDWCHLVGPIVVC